MGQCICMLYSCDRSSALLLLGHKSPDILSQWFDYYLKTTSPMRCSSQSLSGVSEPLGVMTTAAAAAAAAADSSTSVSPPGSRLDLRTLLLKPFKATNTLLLSSAADRQAPSRHRACSESQPLRMGCRAVVDGGGGTQSRSSTPYTMISGLTDDENQQQTIVYAGDRCPRRGPANGRQSGGGGGVYPGEVVSVKCETDDATTSPVRSPLSTYSTHSVKDKGPNSQDSQSSGAEYLGQFQNGRLQSLAEEGRLIEERSPPTLKCEVDRGSPYPEDRVNVSHCFEIDDKYLTNLRDHPHPKETLRKSSNIARLLHPGLLRASDDRPPNLGYSIHPGPSVTPTAHALGQPEDGQQTLKQSKSPAPIQFRETVEQEYAYKQYKRLRKSNTPKSCRQETTSTSPCHSLSKTPDESCGLSGTPSRPHDGSEVLQRGGAAQLAGPERSNCRRTERAPQGYDVGIQCSLISPAEPWIITTEGEEEEEDNEDADDETREEMRSRRRCRARRRVKRKRAFPADENEMPDITASDADCVQMRCSPCGITFDDDVIFSIHMGCHSHTDPFVCNICGRSCDNKYAFNTHILRGHHPT